MEKIKIGDKVVAFVHDGSVVIDNSAFEKLTLTQRAEFLTTAAPQGALSFRENFLELTDYTAILIKLKQGENVTFELLFNGVTMTEDQLSAIRTYHAAIKPVIAAVETLIPPYPFVQRPANGKSLIVVGDRVSNGAYATTLTFAKKLFDHAAPFWCGTAKKPAELYRAVPENSTSYINVNTTAIGIGCQNIMRWQAEELALAQGWTFPTGTRADGTKPKAKAKKA